MKKGIITVGIVALIVGATLIFRKEEKELINITNNEKNTLAFFIEEEGKYKASDTLPTSGYKLNEEKSFCSNGAKPTWSDNSLEILSLNGSNTSCYLYFDEVCKSACKTILAGITAQESPESFTGVATTDEGIFKAEDDDGDTYYYRGAVTNNYVKFANKFWRIIRINGDGTIRLIYQGDTVTGNGQIGTSVFNTSSGNNTYVGFKYGTVGSSTYESTHNNMNKSTILTNLETWYTNNLASYEDKIDPNAGFCNDREPSTSNTTSNGLGGTGTISTYYGVFIRLIPTWRTKQTPTFKCKNSNDLYTLSVASKGNKSLEYPIGLITADEVVYAGGFEGSNNQSYYLFTGQNYWTLSPSYYDNINYARVFYVNSNGFLSENYVHSTYGIRPVINLKFDTTFTYNNETTKGTASDPYIVEGGN